MANPPITRFTSLAVTTAQNSGNPNNGLYVPPLNTAQIAAIPATTKVNGGIWYNTDIGQLETVVQNKVQPVPVGVGGGNVLGPAISTIDNLTSFNNKTGTLIADSGIAKDNVVIAAGAATASKLLTFTGVGKNVQESALVTDNLVTNAGAGVEGNIAIFDASGGKVIQDSGVNIKQVPALAPLLRSSALTMAPTDVVNEISNVGHIIFNSIGIADGTGTIYVDTLSPLHFTTQSFGVSDSQVCTVFSDGLPSAPTTHSALVEIQSDTGALLLSRMTKTERDALSAPSGANGMLLFNTTSGTFNGFDGTNWRDLALFNTNGTLTVADPLSSTNAATKAYVDAAVSGIPTATITLNGNVTGSGLVSSPITTTLNMTLDQIKAPVANLNLNSKNIINLLDPTTAQQAATKNYVDTRSITLSGAVTGTGALGTTISTVLTNITTSQITNFNAAVTAFRLDQFAAPTTSINLNSQKIINLLNPTLAQDAATKNYVDTSISGSGFAPGLATYIVQTATNQPTNAQVLGSLTSGLLKNTTTTGILIIAAPGTDYYSPGFPTTIIDSANNFFIGTGAGNLTLTSSNNTGAGINVLAQLTTGTRNSAFSTNALSSNQTGNSNSAFGYLSLILNTASSNSAFGSQSSAGNSTGSNNSSFGANSLLFSTGSNNSSFGFIAGAAQAIYNNCSFFGVQADASVNNLTNAIAIGYQASVGASNSMVLGGSSGNQLSVGIGITPNAQFQLPTIHANRKIVLYETANNDHQVYGFGTASGTFRFQIDNTTSNYIFNAATSSSTSNELMRLTGGGFLGIGTTPNALLQLANTVVNRKIVLFDANNNDHQFFGFGINSSIFRYQIDSTGSHHIWFAGTSTTTSNELMRLTGGGFLGIGTNAPDQLLTVNSATPSKITAGLWSAFSDARIKDVVGDYEHGLAEIIQIQTRKFKYNDRSGYPESEKAKVNIGIIAQEIEDIFPECIVEKMQKGDIPDMRMYDGTALIYALINAVKELNNEITILKQQINN